MAVPSITTRNKPVNLALTVVLLLSSWWLTQFTVVGLFLPLITVINKLAAEGEGASAAYHTIPLWQSTAVAALAVVVSALTVFLSAKGLKLDQGRPIAWVIILALGVLVLVQAVAAIVVAPHFRAMYHDLGV